METEIGSMFIGIGIMVFLFVVAYWFSQTTRVYKSYVETEIHYNVVEDIFLTRACEKKGIDLKKELIKREVYRDESKSLRKRIKNEIIKELFDNEGVKEPEVTK